MPPFTLRSALLLVVPISSLLFILHLSSPTTLPSLPTSLPSFSSLSSPTPPPSSCLTASSISTTYGRTSLLRSLAHSGTSTRLLRILNLAQSGHPLTIGIIGGSVSTGHGALNGQRFVYGAIPPEQRWYSHVTRYLDSLLPPSSNTEHRVKQLGHNATIGAKPAVGSGYYAWCFGHHIPAEDVDLVMLELAINDQFTKEDGREFERLLRALLTLEKQPAVVVVATMAQVGRSRKEGMTNGGDAQLPVVGYYDVPMISLRNALAPHLLNHPTLTNPYFDIDPRHITSTLHKALGEFVVHHMATQLCSASSPSSSNNPASWWSRLPSLSPSVPLSPPPETPLKTADGISLWPTIEEAGQVPRVPMWSSLADVESGNLMAEDGLIPDCKVAGDNLIPVEGKWEGWEMFDWKDTKHYYQTLKPHQSISFTVTSKAGKGKGRIAMAYLRSYEYGLGKVRCAVDENPVRGKGVVLDGYWPTHVSVSDTTIIAEKVDEGKHEVTCVTLGEEESNDPKGGTAFRIVSLMAV